MNHLYSALLHIRIRYSSPLISLIGCNALMLENGFLKWTLRSGKSRKTLKIVTTNITYNNCMDSKLEVLLTEAYSCFYVNLSALPILHKRIAFPKGKRTTYSYVSMFPWIKHVSTKWEIIGDKNELF